MSNKTSAMMRIGVVLAVTAGGFVLFQHPCRLAETWLVVQIAGLFGAKHFHIIGGTSVLELPHRGLAFLAVVTPSCSSAASIASLTGLGLLVRRTGASRARRATAVLAACTVVFVGNVVRLAVVLIVGLVAGRYSLVMFHDWVASMFSFGYTLGGFILLLYIVLGHRSRAIRSVLPFMAGAHKTEGNSALA